MSFYIFFLYVAEMSSFLGTSGRKK